MPHKDQPQADSGSGASNTVREEANMVAISRSRVGVPTVFQVGAPGIRVPDDQDELADNQTSEAQGLLAEAV